MKGADKLTDTELRAAVRRALHTEVPKLFDGKGLFLLVTRESAQRGKGYWRLKYRIDGKEKLISLGVYPEVPLKSARKRRDKAREQLEQKTDPSAQRQAEKAARRNRSTNTLEAVGTEWFAKKSRAWVKSNSDRIRDRLNKDVYPHIGDLPITDLTSPKLLEVLRLVEDRGAIESAHRIRQYLNSIFQYAIDTHRLQANPIPKPGALASPTKGRFASITDPKGVGSLMRAIDGYQGTLVVQTALKLAPLAFVRPGELRAAEWAEFDLDAAEWRIPIRRMKMKAAHFVPLSCQAVALLKLVRQLTGSGQFVFPSERGHKRPMSANTLNAALRSLGFSKTQMTAHGFRHMASTLLNESGKWNRDAIERQLAHTDQDSIRAAYNFSQHLEERRRMMQWWSDYLETLRNAGDKVVKLSAAGKRH
ncbi:MAG TPA: integrase arm-type DNA-binding domain-containing protein [Steroidobacteraceae bacterium]|nr:integrase arm-type DNA-binding domain-containing protein [Steroidobacteraceae bacterium]